MASTAEIGSCWEGGESSKKTDSEDDLHLLLDCLRFQQHSVPAQKQALTTIATMCSNSNNTRNLFNTTGGLSYVLELMFRSQSSDVQQAALYTLGCASENNLVNQLKLCNERLFSYLAELMVTSSNDLPSTLIIAVAFLSGCLMSNNVQGQKLAKDTGLLSKLMTMFRSALPLSERSRPKQVDGASAASLKQPPTPHQHRLWSSMCSALCTATNNPQNDVNQSQCVKLFPAALSVLDTALFDVNIVRPAISFLASCTANNKGAQDRLRMVGGLKALVNTLRTVVQSLNSHTQFSELPIHIVKTLSAAAFGHGMNCNTLVELYCVELLLCLLQCPDLDDSTKLNITLCLGMLAEDNAAAQKKVASSSGMRLLVDVMASSQCEELSKATAFVLQCCVDKNSSSPDATAINEKIAHIDKLLSQDRESSESPESVERCEGITQEGLEILATKKLPANDLVTAWLDNHVPEDSSPPAESWSNHKPVTVTPHQDTPELARNEEASVPCTAQETESVVMVELRREKERREWLEARLEEEREKREKLEKELLSRKEAIQLGTRKEVVQPVAKTQTSDHSTSQVGSQELVPQTKTKLPLPNATSQAVPRKSTARTSSKPPLSAQPTSQVPAQGSATRTPPISTRTNVRYAVSTKPYPQAIKRLVHRSKLGSNHSHPGPPNTACSSTHSLVNLVYKFSCTGQGSAPSKTGNDNPQTKEVRAVERPHLVKKVLQPPITERTHQSARRSCEDCEQECLGCKPRLKCPLINSRNFIKLLRLDQYTCSYHRRIAFKLKGDDVIPTSAKSLINHHLSSSLKHPPLQCTRHHNMAPPSVASTIRSLDVDHAPQERDESWEQPSIHVTSDDPNYTPSPQSESTIEHTPPTETNTLQLCSQHVQGRVVAPPSYKLVPGTVGTFQNAKKLLRQPFRDITNTQTVRSNTVGGRDKSLAVFDYVTPQDKSKYLPQRNSPLVLKPKASPKKRAKAVVWTKQEERFLLEGVQLLGLGQWRHILAAYKFHPSRDSSSLRVKYRNMCHQNRSP